MTKVIFDIEIRDAKIDIALQRYAQRMKELRREAKGVKEGTEEFERLATEIAQAKTETTRLKEEQKALNREFKQTQVAADSLAGLRLQYAKLTDQVSKLNKEQRESAAGQSLIRNAAKLKGEIDGIEQSVGRFTGNVGNYKSALMGIGDFFTGGLIAGGAVVAVEKLTQSFQYGVQVSGEYSNKLQEISALTGQTGGGLVALQEVEAELRNIEVGGQEIVNTGTNILNALKLVGGARPELLKDADALGQVTEQAIILSKASGDTLEDSVKSLTVTLGQFELQSSDSVRVINELAAGAKEGSAEIPDITASLREFGSVAKISNVSTSESVALIETLAESQLKGAEAGTQLRNILAKLAAADILPKPAQEQFRQLGIDIEVLKDRTLPLETRLLELGKAQGDVAALTKIFGLENLQAATILTESIPKYQELSGKIEGTNEATKQAAIRAKDSQTAWGNLSAAIENEYIDTFTKFGSSFSFVASGLTSIVEGVDSFDVSITALLPTFSAFSALWDSVFGSNPNDAKEFAEGFNFLGEGILTTLDAATGTAAAFPPLAANINNAQDAAKKTAAEMAKLKAIIGDEDKKFAGGRKEIEAAAGSLEFLRKKVQEAQKQLEQATPDRLAGAVQLLKNAQVELGKLQFEIDALQTPFDLSPLSEIPVSDITAPINITTNLPEQAAQNAAETTKKAFEAVKENAIQGQRSITAAFDAEQTTAAEKQKQQQKQIADAAINGAQQVASAIIQIQVNRAEREKELQLDLLDKEFEARKEAAQGNAAALEIIEKDFQKKREAIEREAARKRKRAAITEAIINGANRCGSAAQLYSCRYRRCRRRRANSGDFVAKVCKGWYCEVRHVWRQVTQCRRN
jgi:TP901 family phage tail tape measure protein